MGAGPTLPHAWRRVARVLTAVGDPTRQRILLLFGPDAPVPLKDVVDGMPLSRTAVVHHLRVLEAAGVIARSRRGRDVVFRAQPEAVRAAIGALGAWVDGRFPPARAARRQSKGGGR